MKKGISTRMKNIMQSYVGKSYDVCINGHFYWTLKIVGLMGDTGYFITELNDGTKVWESNASYGEIKAETRKGSYIEKKEVSEKESESNELSPMMKEYYELKEKHPKAMLLFRCGDFYETYEQDARDASKVLGITLTRSCRRYGKDGKHLEMAGFPYHALDTYLPRLIRAGFKIAICDQLEEPKKTVKRGISELVAPMVNQ